MVDLSNERPSIQLEGLTIHLRASSLGRCPRSLAASILGLQGTAASAWLNQTAQEGHLHEGSVKARIERDYKFVLVDQQGLCQWEYEVGRYKFIISGHYEGVWAVRDEPMFLWENKSMSDGQFKKWRVVKDVPTFQNHPHYAWQISHYMMCYDLPVLYSVKNRNDGQLNISFIWTPPHDEAAIRARLETIVEMVEAGPDALDDNSVCEPSAKFFCPHKESLSCLAPKPLPAHFEEVDDPELEDAIVMYEAAKADAASAKKMQAAARQTIVDRMGGGSIVTTMGFTASLSDTEVTDWDAIAAELAKTGKKIADFKKPSQRLNTGKPKGL